LIFLHSWVPFFVFYPYLPLFLPLLERNREVNEVVS